VASRTNYLRRFNVIPDHRDEKIQELLTQLYWELEDTCSPSLAVRELVEKLHRLFSIEAMSKSDFRFRPESASSGYDVRETDLDDILLRLDDINRLIDKGEI